MAYTIQGPMLGSGDNTGSSSGEIPAFYVVTGDNPATDNETTAQAAAYAAAPADWEGLGLVKYSSGVESLGNWKWRVRVNYRPASNTVPGKPQVGDPPRRRSTTKGRTENIKSAIATVSSHKIAGLPDADFGELINVTDEAAEGVDIVVARWSESITKALSDTDFQAIKATLFATTGKVNQAAWNGFQAGEVLFLGVDAEERPEDGVWEVTFDFEAAPNRTGIVLGDIPAFAAKGQEYVWARTAPADGGAGITRKPTHAFVQQVYEQADFSALGV